MLEDTEYSALVDFFYDRKDVTMDMIRGFLELRGFGVCDTIRISGDIATDIGLYDI